MSILFVFEPTLQLLTRLGKVSEIIVAERPAKAEGQINEAPTASAQWTSVTFTNRFLVSSSSGSGSV